MIIEYEEKKYKFVKEDGNNIIFKRIGRFEDKTLLELLNLREITKEYIEELNEEYDDYNSRVEEFRYCGYNEEDSDFHGMVLHLNSIGDNIDKEEEDMSEINDEISKREKEMGYERFQEFLEENDFEY